MASHLVYYPALEAQTQERGAFWMSALAGALPVVMLPLLWRYEEPGKAVSLAVTALVYSLGVLAISVAQRLGIVSRRAPWILVFALKLALCWFITQYLWVAPLEPNFLRVPYQNAGLQDANIYDYVAARIAEEGLTGNVQLLWFTWLSFGVIGYLSLIYSLFGVSVLYVSLFNALLSLVGVLCLTGAMTVLAGSNRRWQLLRFAMLLPFGSYYDATPSKEPLTHALFYCGLFLIARLLARKGRPAANITVLVGALLLLATVRLNVAVLLLLSNLVLFWRRLDPVKLVLLSVAGVMTLVTALVLVSPEPEALASDMFNLGRQLDNAQMVFLQRSATGDTPLKLAVGAALTPRTVVDLALLAPVRLAIWMFLPYPEIIPDFAKLASMPEMLVFDRLGYFRFATELPAQLSAVLMILLIPNVLAGLRAAGMGWRNWFLASNLLIPALIISNLMFIMGRRYRALLEPLVVAIAIWGLQYGRPRRLRYVLYSAFAAGLAVLLIYRTFGTG